MTNKLLNFFIVPPKPAILRIVSTTPDSITVQWESVDDGYSPITRAMLNYKMTYGEWDDTEVVELVLSIYY